MTSANQKTFFIDQLLITLPDVFSGHTESPPQLFDLLTLWFGKYSGATSSFDAVATALKH